MAVERAGAAAPVGGAVGEHRGWRKQLPQPCGEGGALARDTAAARAAPAQRGERGGGELEARSCCGLGGLRGECVGHLGRCESGRRLEISRHREQVVGLREWYVVCGEW